MKRKRKMTMNQKIKGAGIILLIVGLAVIPSSDSTSTRRPSETPHTNTLHTREDPGTVSGYVTDIALNPIEGAQMRVSYHETSQEAYSDASGYYHVTNIPICNCTKNCTCSKQGYNPAWVCLSIGENTTYDFVLTSKGQWFSVGGAGPNNYTKIQDAIDNTSDGDTVYVFPGSYKEHLVINTSIQLQGATPLSTMIDGQNASNDIITCVGTDVFIGGFTIFNCSMGSSVVRFNHTRNCTLYGTKIHTGEYGVTIQNGQNINIINNTFLKTPSTKTGYVAIRLLDCVYCTISQNNISSWVGGILLSYAHLRITKNTITKTQRGITDMMNALPGVNMYFIIDENYLSDNNVAVFLAGSQDYSITRNEITNSSTAGLSLVEEVFSGVNPKNVTIKNNLITDSTQGIVIEYSINVSVEGNLLHRNILGLSFHISSFTSVKKNTFQENELTATYQWSVYPFSRLSDKIPRFDENFWDNPQQTPYPIIGTWSFLRYPIFFKFPWVTYDQHPASEPYLKGGYNEKTI
jgi:parallel beta-helix repeat protein